MIEGTRIFATNGSQTIIRNRLNSAEKSYMLLKKKSDTLLIQFKEVLFELFEKKSSLTEVMGEASFSLAEVNYITGNINHLILESVNKATIKTLKRREIIMGVNIETYEYYEEGLDPFLYTGLARGRQQVMKVKNNYRKALKLLIKLASLQSSFIILEEHLKATNCRVNALRYIIIPRLHSILTYIVSELDELASSRHVALEWGDKDEVREEGGSKQMPPLAIVATLLGRITKVSITRTPVESGCFSP
ncbi:putative V-type proton ATPase subunit D 2 isoform X1 [Vespula maculifrons]|uniref:V-type proton ATPase subunit D 2 isoform X1 n=1 Tax=Vespula maculifrons TaxID=7453 RepID=A0ABD2AQV7_VESMC